jgi:sporulation protein YlmC with PRC-barrel domain
MDIPIDAEVYCTDGLSGRSTYIVLDPVTDTVTHFIVEETTLPNIERLVPIDHIERSEHNRIDLNCTRSELEKMESFIETDFIQSNTQEYSVPFDYPTTTPLLIWPYLELPNEVAVLRLEHIPPSELAVRRGAGVEATDGHVGEVDEFVINKENGHITHLVLREGHMWGEKDITIPVSEIDRIEENAVFLKISKSKVGSLPVIPVNHRWR